MQFDIFEPSTFGLIFELFLYYEATTSTISVFFPYEYFCRRIAQVLVACHIFCIISIFSLDCYFLFRLFLDSDVYVFIILFKLRFSHIYNQ